MRMMHLRQWGMVGVAVLLVAMAGGCKSSGVAVSAQGHVMEMDINVPTDLSAGEAKELTVRIANMGINKIDDVIFEVEMPNELIVLSQVPGRGITMTERFSSTGTKIFQYRAGDIEVGTSSQVKFHVQAASGALPSTGAIKVTAWSDDLPENRLIETKEIKLRA